MGSQASPHAGHPRAGQVLERLWVVRLETGRGQPRAQQPRSSRASGSSSPCLAVTEDREAARLPQDEGRGGAVDGTWVQNTGTG